MPTERPAQRLRDILDNSARICAYTGDLTRDQFAADQRTVDAVERCFERICEAARKLGDAYDARYPDLGLPELRRFGSKLRHDYGDIDPLRMWAFRRRLGDLEAFARSELERLDDGS